MQAIHKFFEQLSATCTAFAGSSGGFGTALFIVLAWAICGPFFHYSENWQIVINTATTIVTFLMVFLIQRAQNKDVTALHAKLNELIASSSASNRLVNIENMTEEELMEIKDHFVKLSGVDDTGKDQKSIEDAIARADDRSTSKADR